MCTIAEVLTEEVLKEYPEPVYTDYPDSTFMVVSKIAYLIGIPKRIFENEHEAPKLEWFEKLETNKNARIIRNLCMLRTAIEQNFSQISNQIIYELKNLTTLPELVPQESIRQLSADGIQIIKANQKPAQYIIDLNGHIVNRINNCKDIFPIWLNWDYVRDLFVMPNGLKEGGLKAAAAEYYLHKNGLPYQVYMNWPGSYDGNILYNDKKFVKLLYEAHEDCFRDMSKVSDAGLMTKDNIYCFLEDSDRVEIVVDCENADPFKLVAMLNNLDQEALLERIVKIVLYDDVHTTSAWDILNKFTQIPIDHVEIERVKEQKSYLDVRLTAGACKAYYTENVDAFILISSDSDYWGLINALDEARFLVMVESGKVGSAIRRTLEDSGITYCYIDDFCTGNSYELKLEAVLTEVRRTLSESLHLNVTQMTEDAYTNTRAGMTESERRQFYDRYIKNMKLVIAPDGTASIQLDA
ncbi:MAG: NYN domain-containing protein [Clostridia bacterium]|nr:NYN domain-containing protein [Clostridia bacterium]